MVFFFFRECPASTGLNCENVPVVLFKNNKVITEMCNLGPPAPLPHGSWKTSSMFRSPGPGLAWGTWYVPFLSAGPRETTVSASRSESGVSVHVQKNDVPVFIPALSSPSVFPVQNVLPPALLRAAPVGFRVSASVLRKNEFLKLRHTNAAQSLWRGPSQDPGNLHVSRVSGRGVAL